MRWALLLLIACQNSKPREVTAPTSPPPPPADARLDGPRPLAEVLPAAIGSGNVGTPHRVIRFEADPKGRWAVVCQQRKDTNNDGKISFSQEAHFALGDAPDPYFVVGGGEGVEIEEVRAVSPSGDHIVIEMKDRALLVDVHAQTATPLPRLLRAAFTPDGTQLAYVDTSTPPQLVRRDLARGVTKTMTLPALSQLDALRTDASGRWILLTIATSDYHDGRDPFDAWCELGMSRDGEPNKWMWVDVDNGKVVDDPEVIRPLGDRMLTRDGTQLALDGAPIGPKKKCDELDVLGVYEPTGGVLSLCLVKQPHGFTVHYDAAGGSSIETPGWPPRVFKPNPDALPGPVFCFPNGKGVCIDLASATLVPRQVAPAVEPTHVLAGNPDVSGPMRWELRTRKH